MNKTMSPRPEFLYKFATMTNAEAYVEVFHNRLMKPMPDTGLTGEYWGSTTRAEFYPMLRDALCGIHAKPFRILDVGAGSGEMVDHVLKDYAADVSIVEPNLFMMHRYMQSIRRYPRLNPLSLLSQPVQTLYAGQENNDWFKKLPPQEFILASHMIYGLTDSRREDGINPEEDLLNFLTAMYEKLTDGGTLFIVYAVGEDTLLGEAAAHHLRIKGGNLEENVRKTWLARTNLLEHACAKLWLDARFPRHVCKFTTKRVESRIYGDNVEDIAAYCTLGELTQIDGEHFDISKLQHSLNFIKNHADDYNLRTVIGSQRDGMLTATIPQVVCKLQKCRRLLPRFTR